MSKLTIQIHNIETGETIERDMNAEELAKYKAGEDENNKLIAEAKVKADAKAALLNKLGITSEEAQLLLS